MAEYPPAAARMQSCYPTAVARAGLALTLALAVAASACGSRETPEVLAELRSQLDRVRATPDDEDFAVPELLEVGALVVQPRGEIRAGLGEPYVCTAGAGAACTRPGDWYYSFYHLPPNAFGGGPELVLEFDATGECSSAKWVHTQ